MKTSLSLRRMQTADIEALLPLQCEAYQNLELERASAFQSKLQFAPTGCWVALDRDGLCGYVFSQPSRWLSPPAIGAPLRSDVGADCWYLHDLVVAARVRGQRLATQLLRHVQRSGREAGFDRLALTSVASAVGYWQRHGFVEIEASAALQSQLAEYGAGARYMAQGLSEARHPCWETSA